MTTGHNIIVIGASAGGVEALVRLVQDLPQELDASIFVVVHLPSHIKSVLPDILSRCKSLPAKHPQDREPIAPGQIYVAPPDYHLLIQPGVVRLLHGPRENGHRPAIDPLFRTASKAYGPRVIGVILSGTLDDGTAGSTVVKARSGITVVQEPAEALFAGMPQSVIDHVEVDHILSIAEIAAILPKLVDEPVNGDFMATNEDLEAEFVKQDKLAREEGLKPSSPSTMTCPDCGGVLWELGDGGLLRFRCHVGHAYSVDSLLAEQADSIEVALWSAVRSLEEKAALCRRLATQADRQNRRISEQRFQEQATEVTQQANIIRGLLHQQAWKNSKSTADPELIEDSDGQIDP